MAARRLVVVMLVLLGISTLAAVLVPTREESGETAPEPPRRKAGEQAGGDAGRLVRRRVEISNASPRLLRIHQDDQLELLVAAPYADQIAIPAFGLVEPVDPYAPARFDLLAERPGSFAVTALDAGREVARIEVRRREPAG